MNEEIISIDIHSSQGDVRIETESSISAGAITPTSSSLNLTVPKTARDKFFEDLQHEKDKNRWSAKCLLCEKSKRIIDTLGVTSNFTRHAREYHKEEYEQWLIQNSS